MSDLSKQISDFQNKIADGIYYFFYDLFHWKEYQESERIKRMFYMCTKQNDELYFYFYKGNQGAQKATKFILIGRYWHEETYI